MSTSLDAVRVYRDNLLARDHIRDLHDSLAQLLGTNRHCTNCEHFNHQLEICKQANVRPPATIIVNGCQQWKQDIPF